MGRCPGPKHWIGSCEGERRRLRRSGVWRAGGCSVRALWTGQRALDHPSQVPGRFPGRGAVGDCHQERGGPARPAGGRGQPVGAMGGRATRRRRCVSASLRQPRQGLEREIEARHFEARLKVPHCRPWHPVPSGGGGSWRSLSRRSALSRATRTNSPRTCPRSRYRRSGAARTRSLRPWPGSRAPMSWSAPPDRPCAPTNLG